MFWKYCITNIIINIVLRMFWKYCITKQIVREHNLNMVHIDQLLGGHAPPAQRRKYRDNNERIVRIVREFDQRDRMDYLRGIAHNIAF